MRKISILILAAIGLASCQSENRATGEADSTALVTAADTLPYTYDSVKVYSKAPVSPGPTVKDTSKAVISFPRFKDEAVNQFVLLKTMATSGPDKHYKDYQEYANGFISGFESFKAQEKEYGQTWFLDISNKVVAQRPGYLSLLNTFVSYEGGAHPNTVFTYLNYDPAGHREILLDSLLVPGGKAKLTSVAEKIFRAQEKLAPKASLADGYFFKDNVFALNDNFTITDKGLMFLYNPYEIKAYVFGKTELTIPFAELKDIARPNSLLTNY